MARPKILLLLLLVVVVVVLASPALSSVAGASSCRFPALFILGDSLSDSGNCIRYQINPQSRFQSFVICDRTLHQPYGRTFSSKGFFRFSDSRILIDFLATYLGLPYINSYLNAGANFSSGVNYALSSATALRAAYLRRRLVFTFTRISIDNELDWHRDIVSRAEAASHRPLPGLPSRAAFAEALYVVEIGGDDYFDAFNSLRGSAFVIANLIKPVVQKIRNVTQALYDSGARNILITGITPLGCLPRVLALKRGPKDEIGCLKAYNEISDLHTAGLLAEIKSLRRDRPDGRFTFLDYNAVFKHIQQNSAEFGFTNLLDACCGNPNRSYHFTIYQLCNNRTSTVCANPNAYINWDGFHFTEAFNFAVFKETIVKGAYLDPPNAFEGCAAAAARGLERVQV